MGVSHFFFAVHGYFCPHLCVTVCAYCLQMKHIEGLDKDPAKKKKQLVTTEAVVMRRNDLDEKRKSNTGIEFKWTKDMSLYQKCKEHWRLVS